MNVFWMDRDGVFPPEDACFGCVPFIQKSPSYFTSVNRVRHLPSLTLPIRVLQRTFSPGKEEWMAKVRQTTQAIEQNIFDKVVLARCCTLECETAPDPFAVTARLLEKAKNSTVFCFAEGQTAFLGATPELLFSKRGKEIESEALAGTCRRGNEENEDKDLEEALFANGKARREIFPVAHFLQNRLSPLCASPLTCSPLHVRKTSNVQHLCMQIQGRLQEKVSDGDILEKIHPTPALCGMPPKPALHWILQKEPFERGFYGGTFGWSTPKQSVWMVAIRCCLIQNTTVKLYTGAGIVAGSDPEEEWEELNRKMELYRDIFV